MRRTGRRGTPDTQNPGRFDSSRRLVVDLAVLEQPDARLAEAGGAREGADATIVTYGAMVHASLEAAAALEKDDGIGIEVLDLRTLLPMDDAAIAESVKKTGRLLIVHEAPKACGFGAEMIAQICEEAFMHLEAPPRRVTGWDTPFPFTLENEYLPLAHRIAPALLETARF